MKNLFEGPRGPIIGSGPMAVVPSAAPNPYASTRPASKSWTMPGAFNDDAFEGNSRQVNPPWGGTQVGAAEARGQDDRRRLIEQMGRRRKG